MSVCPVASLTRTPAGTGIIAATAPSPRAPTPPCQRPPRQGSVPRRQARSPCDRLDPVPRLEPRAPFVLDPHLQKLEGLRAAARGASRVPAPPDEQYIGIDAVALGHLRNGRARRQTLATIRRFSSLDQNPRRPALFESAVRSTSPVFIDSAHYR